MPECVSQLMDHQPSHCALVSACVPRIVITKRTLLPLPPALNSGNTSRRVASSHRQNVVTAIETTDGHPDMSTADGSSDQRSSTSADTADATRN
jgi:hypothetical protein